jgi:hypothetical protein
LPCAKQSVNRGRVHAKVIGEFLHRMTSCMTITRAAVARPCKDDLWRASPRRLASPLL